MRGGRYRGSSITISDIEEAEKSIGRYYYRGQPTRKHKRLVRMSEKFDRDFALAAAQFGRYL